MLKVNGSASSISPSIRVCFYFRTEQEADAGQTITTPPATVKRAPVHLSSCHRIPNAVLATMTCLLLIGGLLSLSAATPFTLTGRYCKQNVSVKYQVPITHLSQPTQHAADANAIAAAANFTTTINCNTNAAAADNFVTYEPRVRWEATNVCCPGYRALLFGFCEPICEMNCPRFSYCATPNQCECLPGYVEHHPNNKEQQLLDCRPICVGGCPRHSHCVARNRCECRAGYRNSNTWWFLPLKCARITCVASDQRYDVEKRACVQIEMSIEELMQKVAARLAMGTSASRADDEFEVAEEVETKEEVQNKVGRDIMLQTYSDENIDEK